MALHNIYKPRYSIRIPAKSKIYLYKDGYLRRFFERRGRRAKRGGLFRSYVLVPNKRKWTIARRFIRPIRYFSRLYGPSKASVTTLSGGRPKSTKYDYKNRYYHKQRIRHFYGKDKEEAFRTLYRSYKTIQGSTSHSFFSLLESRLDRTLYRRRIFPTFYGCRQFINYHGVYVNNNLETSTRYISKMGDVLSLPVFAWRSLYWDLYCRVYYRRWGRYISSRRFHKQFNKKIFKARCFFIPNTNKTSNYFNKKSFRISIYKKNENKLWPFKVWKHKIWKRKNWKHKIVKRRFWASKSSKIKSIEKKLWFNYRTPFSFTKSFKYFKPKKSISFRNNKKEIKKTVRQYYLQQQRNNSRRGFFLLRAMPQRTTNDFNSKQKKLSFLKKLNSFVLQKRIKWRRKIRKPLLKFAFEQGLNTNIQSINSSNSTEFFKKAKNSNWIVGKHIKKSVHKPNKNKKNITTFTKKSYGVTYYLKKKYNRIKEKKLKKEKKNRKNQSYFSKNSFYKHYIQKQKFSSRIFLKARGQRLFRREFSKNFSIFDKFRPMYSNKIFNEVSPKNVESKKNRNDAVDSVRTINSVSFATLISKLLKKIPQKNRQIKSSYIQYFRKQWQATKDAYLELEPAPHPEDFKNIEVEEQWDSKYKPRHLYFRKWKKLCNYFYIRKMRTKKVRKKKIFFSKYVTYNITKILSATNFKQTSDTDSQIHTKKTAPQDKASFKKKRDTFFSSRIPKSNIYTTITLKRLKKKLLPKGRKKKNFLAIKNWKIKLLLLLLKQTNILKI